MEYNKAFHYIDSPSVFWDLDTLIYIAILALIIWGLIRLSSKIRKSSTIGFPEFCARFLYTAYVPLFLLYFIPLLLSRAYIPSNFIIAFLPLLYGGILQFIIGLIYRRR